MDKHLCMFPQAAEGSLYFRSPLFRTYGGDLMNRFDMERWLNEYVTLKTALENIRTSEKGYTGGTAGIGSGTLAVQIRDRISDMEKMQVLAPEYLVSPAPEMISHYLHTGRAADMSQALNLYHTEMYRARSLALQQGQLLELRAMASRQQMAMWQREAEHRARMVERRRNR